MGKDFLKVESKFTPIQVQNNQQLIHTLLSEIESICFCFFVFLFLFLFFLFFFKFMKRKKQVAY